MLLTRTPTMVGSILDAILTMVRIRGRVLISTRMAVAALQNENG